MINDVASLMLAFLPCIICSDCDLPVFFTALLIRCSFKQEPCTRFKRLVSAAPYFFLPTNPTQSNNGKRIYSILSPSVLRLLYIYSSFFGTTSKLVCHPCMLFWIGSLFDVCFSPLFLSTSRAHVHNLQIFIKRTFCLNFTSLLPRTCLRHRIGSVVEYFLAKWSIRIGTIRWKFDSICETTQFLLSGWTEIERKYLSKLIQK